MDFDGAYEYSEVVSIQRSEKQEITLFPNPVKNTLFLQNAQGMVNIHNSIGQRVLTVKINDSQNAELDVSDLPNGTYFLFIDNGISRSVGNKFVKF